MLFGALIDLDPNQPEGEAKLLLAEIDHLDGEEQVAYRNGIRFAARLSPWEGKTIQDNLTPFSPDGAYLISGGLGGLGLEIARWMAEEGARRIILLSRSCLPPRSQWESISANSRAAQQVTLIRKIEALGTSVYLFSVDVSDEGQLKDFLQTYTEQVGVPIRGVIHAAGVIQDQSIEQMVFEKMKAVLRPKILGGWLLHEKLSSQPLDFFVLFSSSSALTGSPGQANYTAANAFLDGLAYYRMSCGLHGLSINWGPWAEVGMSARSDLEERRTRLGMNSISTRQGLRILGQLIFQKLPQIGVIPVKPERLWSMSSTNNKFLELLRPTESKSEQSQQSGISITEQILQAPPADRPMLVRFQLKARIGKILQMNSAPIPEDHSLIELGFDSIMIMELIRGLDQDFGLTLYPREIFDLPSISAMIMYLSEEMERIHLTSIKAMAEEKERSGVAPPAFPEVHFDFENPTRRNPGIIFLLSSPRAGSTLLRVMLAGHPGLFSPPELHLLPFKTMKERQERLQGSYLDEGLQRAVMELKSLDFEQSKALIDEWIEADLPIQQVYSHLQELAWPRILVDKSPSYGMEIQVLERAEAIFENVKYIHLVRHPYAVIDSFVHNRIEKLFDGGGTDPFQLAEKIWATSVSNTIDFLDTLETGRQLLIRYEDLVRDPETITGLLCTFLGIDFDPAVLQPYEGQRMTDGVQAESQSIGDPNFLKRNTISR